MLIFALPDVLLIPAELLLGLSHEQNYEKDSLA